MVYWYFAGLLWSKQFYAFKTCEWLQGDLIPPPAARYQGRNGTGWEHLVNNHVISVPDKWEYPWVS